MNHVDWSDPPDWEKEQEEKKDENEECEACF